MSTHEYNATAARHLSNIGWHGCLNEATTPEDVVARVRDHLALWTPKELAQIPHSLRPSKIVDAEDVNLYALQLVRAQQDCTIPPLVHRMATFMSAASLRLTEILARSSEVSSEDD